LNIDHYIRTGLAGTAPESLAMSKLTEVQQIQQQIKDLQARAALLIMEGRDDAIAQIKTMMADYTIDAADLGLVLKPPPRKRDRQAANPRPPMFRDPVSGATWTGQGASPKWLEGQDREAFRIVPVPDVRPTP
jgi:DNA-binding protein H-NS